VESCVQLGGDSIVLLCELYIPCIYCSRRNGKLILLQIDLELSNSDTDTSFLEATPPHRFSDSELESQIEIMSITLDTVLNLGSTPVSDWANRSMSKDDIFTVDLRVEHLDEDSQLDETQNELKELEQNDEPLLIQDDNSSTTHLEENMKGKVATEEMDGKNDCGSPEKKIKTDSIPRKRPPLRPFRRQISLPASIFMSYLLAAEKNLATKADNNNGQRKTDFSGMQNHNSLKKINQNNSQVVYGSRRILSKINGSCSSSNESTEEHDHNEEEGSEGNVGEMEMRSLMTSVDDSSLSSSTTTTPIYLNGDELSLGQDDTRNKDVSSISSNRMSFSDAQDDNTGHVDSSAAFTSEIERRSLLLRYMRRLIRQDTSVNFAPNDYCI